MTWFFFFYSAAEVHLWTSLVHLWYILKSNALSRLPICSYCSYLFQYLFDFSLKLTEVEWLYCPVVIIFFSLALKTPWPLEQFVEVTVWLPGKLNELYNICLSLSWGRAYCKSILLSATISSTKSKTVLMAAVSMTKNESCFDLWAVPSFSVLFTFHYWKMTILEFTEKVNSCELLIS